MAGDIGNRDNPGGMGLPLWDWKIQDNSYILCTPKFFLVVIGKLLTIPSKTHMPDQITICHFIERIPS